MVNIAVYNDFELISRLQNDDVQAFDLLYRKYHTVIYKNIFKLVKDSFESENILQDVFVTLWEKRYSIDPRRPVANWLFTVSYHMGLKLLKERLKQFTMISSLVANDMIIDDGPASASTDRLSLVEEAMTTLSPQKRKVFDLCKIQGKTYEETAKELNISKHTVKEYLSAAVKVIQSYVEEHPQKHIAVINMMILFRLLN